MLNLLFLSWVLSRRIKWLYEIGSLFQDSPIKINAAFGVLFFLSTYLGRQIDLLLRNPFFGVQSYLMLPRREANNSQLLQRWGRARFQLGMWAIVWNNMLSKSLVLGEQRVNETSQLHEGNRVLCWRFVSIISSALSENYHPKCWKRTASEQLPWHYSSMHTVDLIFFFILFGGGVF